MITASGERDKRVCRASRVRCCKEPVISAFLALIQHHYDNTGMAIVNLGIVIVDGEFGSAFVRKERRLESMEDWKIGILEDWNIGMLECLE